MSEALSFAIYLIVCRELGETAIFPGSSFCFDSVEDNSYASSLADMTIWATTHSHTANEAFNHTNGDTFFWRYFYPKIGKYFGMDVRP
jgi:hypothetical protein